MLGLTLVVFIVYAFLLTTTPIGCHAEWIHQQQITNCGFNIIHGKSSCGRIVSRRCYPWSLRRCVFPAVAAMAMSNENKKLSLDSCSNDDDKSEHLSPSQQRSRQRRLQLDSGEVITIRSRSVAITPAWNITVWEIDKPAVIMQNYWEQVEDYHRRRQDSINESRLSALGTDSSSFAATSPLDPFGLVAWPGSVVAARELLQHHQVVQNKTVLILGAGPGVEALAAASLGARQVIATDLHPITLAMLRYTAMQAKLDHVVTTRVLDIAAHDDDCPLIDCDVMVVADVMYNPILAQHIGRRCWEALQRNMTVLVSDSQRLADFVPFLQNQLDDLLPAKRVYWQERTLTNFSGSGVMVNEDQVYHVKARVLWLGLVEEVE
jgi:predicted nicotinamide N-methyase